ncbi:bifunctional oligoribonuclease/PAP phosphatase NrnA [Pullulanibacillus sp. KACC 23026]|uniref:DHH family phosphoesterase n=1 Tax=Pullulanibacillus sp. KACC 23026 TaxID=3028315 RepID=UPI0023AED292|nr:bifunctional oligoribonuclease/PAP phosphatase NrnA [Pullulanibacillus sp. KACC 23026]WEG13895.1 bifunctional oligoribonuclease/PAP phosphatase NrnA [Pullulanibacillus sp. KACC 23026]
MEDLFSLIKAYDTIVIHRHVRPDPDALGSQAGLSALIKDNFRNKKVYMVGEEVASLTFIAKMDTIQDDLYKGALVIVCDTANLARISDQRYKLGEKLLKIDHHPNNEPYGDWMWVDTDASSVSEMIASLYEANSDLTLSEEAAEALYAGIVGDTGRFQFSNTTSKTHRLVAKLLEKNIQAEKLINQMELMPLAQLRLQGEVLRSFDFLEGGVGVMRLTKELLDAYALSSIEASNLVNSFSSLEGLKAWVFFIEEPDKIRVRLRSKGPMIHTLAARYNGGGHPMASGATVYSWEEAQVLVEELQSICLKV